MSQLQAWVRRALWDVVPRDHRQSDHELRRRQLVTFGVVVLGAVVLGISLRVDPGSRWFYVSTLGLAGLWTVGAFASGPLHLGRIPTRQGTSRPVVTPIVLGLLLAGVFVAGAFLVRTLDFLEGLESQVVNVIGLRRPGLDAAARARHRGQRDRRGAVLPRGGVRRDHRAPGALDDRGVRRRDRSPPAT